MNSLQQLVAQAGHKKAERFFGATIAIFQDAGAVNPLTANVPCCHTHLKLDLMQIGSGIQAVSLIENLSFRAERCGGNIPIKGTPITLYPANGAQPLDMQLWDGGLMPDGLTYQFVAVDANFKA